MIRVGERQDTPRAMAFLKGFYEANGLGSAVAKEKVAFLRGYLRYMFCASATGFVSDMSELAALERALIAEEL